MNFSKVAVNRPVTTFMLIMMAIAFGALAIFNLQVDLMPNMNIPVAIVKTTYDGAGPEEIENLITKKIEAQMGTVSGIDTISSTTSNGSSVVIVRFNQDVDIDVAASDMREKIDLIKSRLPDGANDPMVIKIDFNSMIGLSISASSTNMTSSELKQLIEDEVSDRLERQDGVASVTLSGGRDKEIQVVLNQEAMRGFGVSESTISGVLMAENANTPTGTIKQGDKILSVRVNGEFKDIQEIENIPITTSSGKTIYLRDVAEVSEQLADSSSIAYTNDNESVLMSIQKQSTANTVNVSKVVLAELEKIQKEYPSVEFLVVYDPAKYINNSVNNVKNSLVQGALLAVIVLYVFLRNFKSTLVVALSMPISVIATFACMYFSGTTLNMMSLGGLTLGIGMLVDNSIVVLESIYKKLEEGCDKRTAAIEGAREVGMSIIASTLTTVAVFLPITFVGGTAAQMFNDLALTIVFSLSMSLVVAITFVPMLSSIWLDPDEILDSHSDVKSRNIFVRFLDFIGGIISSIETIYKKVLESALSHKLITLIVTFVFVVLTGLSLMIIGFEMMPESDEGAVSISIELPKGSRLETTEAITRKVVSRLNKDEIPELKDISMNIGGGSGSSALTGGSEDTATVTVNLVEKKQRKRTASQVAQSMRTKFDDIPGAEIEVSAQSRSMGSYAGGGIEVRINGTDNDKLKEISNHIVSVVEKIPGTSEVKSSMSDAAPQVTIKVNRDKASAYGISASNVASIVRTAITGSTPTTLKIEDDEYDIRIRQSDDKINYVTDVENILIPTAMGVSVPLDEIADIQIAETPTTITRQDQQKYVTVKANLTDVTVGEVSSQIDEKMQDYIMPDGYSYEYGGSMEQMVKAFSGLLQALVIAVFLLYMIMASQFESFQDPFIIMFSMPIAMTGGIFGLFITGQSVSVTALLGLIMLAGVVVNNAIVLIDYANLLIRERGLDFFQAMKVAGPTRLRPILMSTLTTVLGLVPMMISQSEGAESMRGLAITVVFGLSLSTLVTLLLIPTLFCILRGRDEKRKKKKQAKLEAKKRKRGIGLQE
ncbi:MAG: efflux RND transporter permease subunit [Firmicutes bacterium]|nr:efflux RND transporter permease subunit [Bacillota bacterium]